MPAPTRGRRRTLDQKKKVEICDLVSRGVTVEEAADKTSASFHTVQREIRRDEDFARELRASQRIAPDPLVLMQSAARAHWRAAAWLLERTDPERYAKRPPSSATPEQFEAALTVVLEAALEATPPEQRAAVYQHVQAACDQAFKCVFPNYGPWGKPKSPQLPPTPLADQGRLNRILDPSSHLHVYEKDAARSEPQSPQATPPVDRPLQPQPPAGGRFAAQDGVRAHSATPGQRPGLKRRAGVFTNRILSPKMHFATKFKPGDRSSNQRLVPSQRYRDGVAEALRQAVQSSGAALPKKAVGGVSDPDDARQVYHGL